MVRNSSTGEMDGHGLWFGIAIAQRAPRPPPPPGPAGPPLLIMRSKRSKDRALQVAMPPTANLATYPPTRFYLQIVSIEIVPIIIASIIAGIRERTHQEPTFYNTRLGCYM